MWWKRYEPILEAKAKPAVVVLIDMLAAELSEICEAFPPAEADIEWQDDTLERRFKGRLAELPKPDAAFVDLLGQLLAFDFAHEVEAVDHLFRNDRHREACPTQRHVDALHLLWRVLVDQLLSRKEECSSLLRRRDLVTVAERLPETFRRRQQRVQ